MTDQNVPSTPQTAPLVRTLNPPDVRDVSKIYSHIAMTTRPSNIIYFAGQVGADMNGNVSADSEEQVRLAFSNLKKCLDAAGASVKDILKLTYYVVNYDHTKRYHSGPLYEFLQGHRPPITSLPVVALARPEYLFEVEAVAAIPYEQNGERSVMQVALLELTTVHDKGQ